jgi:hypothetical protein
VATGSNDKYAITSAQGVIKRLGEILTDINFRLVQAESRYDATDRATQEVANQGLRYLEGVIVPTATHVSELLRSLSNLFQTTSTSVVTVQLEPVTFTIKAEDRNTFASLGYVLANSTLSNSGLAGPVVSYDPDSGSIVIDPDYVWGSGTFSSWALVGSPPLKAVVTAAAPVITQGVTELGNSIAADATIRITAVQSDATAKIKTAQDAALAAANSGVRTDTNQGLSSVQKRQAKANIGAFGAGYYGNVSQTTVLPASAIGKTINCGGAAFTITLPAMTAGDAIKIMNQTAFPKMVALSSGNLVWGNTFGTAYTLQPYANAVFECLNDAGECFVFDAAALSSTPSVDIDQTFTQAQKARARKNIGAGRLGETQSSGNTVLTAADWNTLVRISGGTPTFTLPPVSTAGAPSDFLDVVNLGPGLATLAASRANGETSGFYYSGINAGATMPLGSGQSVRLWCDGSNWIPAFRALSVERAVGVDAPPTAFTTAQQLQARTNISAGTLSIIAASGNTQNGYWKRNDGFIFQWGYVASAADVYVPFPVAFSTCLFALPVALTTGYTGDAFAAFADTIAASGFTVRSRRISAGGGVVAGGSATWIAGGF